MQAAHTATAEAVSGELTPTFMERSFPLLTQGRAPAMDALWIFIKLLEELNETDRGSVLCYVIARYTNEGKAK
jgi:hypothetical protein